MQPLVLHAQIFCIIQFAILVAQIKPLRQELLFRNLVNHAIQLVIIVVGMLQIYVHPAFQENIWIQVILVKIALLPVILALPSQQIVLVVILRIHIYLTISV